ncbi:hypothetical protein H4S00_002736, partial [Coemansia sp. D1744]
GEDDGDVGNNIVSHRARRTDSTEGGYTQNDTIPAKAGRSKSRGRQHLGMRVDIRYMDYPAPCTIRSVAGFGNCSQCKVAPNKPFIKV